jgi:hypothetical protein
MVQCKQDRRMGSLAAPGREIPPSQSGNPVRFKLNAPWTVVGLFGKKPDYLI